jgi:omega-amidase
MVKLKVALIQMSVEEDAGINLQKALLLIEQCASLGAKLVILPEMFLCPYQAERFAIYAEKEGGPTWRALSAAAQANQVYLVGGSFPELDSAGKLYNTCFIFDPLGRPIGKHRKLHLFDIQIRGKQSFRESDTLTPGSQVTVVDTPFGKIGVCVCYDLRFPELARLMVQQGAVMLAVPGAFNMTTGPAHWELLFRARAVDNQVTIFGCAPARNTHSSYVSYANSLVVSPWGEITARLGAEEDVLIAEIDLDYVEQVRQELPLLSQRRLDLYEVVQKG